MSAIILSTFYLDRVEEEMEQFDRDTTQATIKELNEAIKIAPFEREVLPRALDIISQLELQL